jgi:two-component system response regulator RegX3
MPELQRADTLYIAVQRKICILIVEDEVAIRTGLMDVFVFHGYEVDYAADGREGLDKALSGTFDLIVLDVMLPGMNGFEVCNRIRREDRDQPIIMLTAKTSDEDIIQGLSLGADDYVAKPFSVAQLMLRVQAVLRRSRIGVEMENHIRLGDEVELDSRNLSGSRGEEALSFTRREMEILQYLNANSERPVSREELLTKVWGYAKNLDIETRTVDIHIAKLRRKIESDPARPRHLITVRGAGYRLLTG